MVVGNLQKGHADMELDGAPDTSADTTREIEMDDDEDLVLLGKTSRAAIIIFANYHF